MTRIRLSARLARHGGPVGQVAWALLWGRTGWGAAYCTPCREVADRGYFGRIRCRRCRRKLHAGVNE